MINISNRPLNTGADARESDFTVDEYKKLLKKAQANYEFVSYSDIPDDKRFILWRHDCDYSLNRAFRLASVEAELNIKATYFLNIRSEYFNALQSSQSQLITEIKKLGHDFGVHLDATFYKLSDESQLDELVAYEASILQKLFDVSPSAFGFHNPTELALNCEKENYGGLVNCYSKYFKTSVPYCSDSNGYWRFKRLYDVLEESENDCLQVLTHPGWWQEDAMMPRQRIFRSVHGRAENTMNCYDKGLLAWGRENLSGPSKKLKCLKEFIKFEHYAICDLLWNLGQLHLLFIELWRLHEKQIDRLCTALIHNKWGVPITEIKLFLTEIRSIAGRLKLIHEISEVDLCGVAFIEKDKYEDLATIKNRLFNNDEIPDDIELEQGCVYLCESIGALAKWGMKHSSIHYDGISRFKGSGMSSGYEGSSFTNEKWREIKNIFIGLEST